MRGAGPERDQVPKQRGLLLVLLLFRKVPSFLGTLLVLKFFHP